MDHHPRLERAPAVRFKDPTKNAIGRQMSIPKVHWPNRNHWTHLNAAQPQAKDVFSGRRDYSVHGTYCFCGEHLV